MRPSGASVREEVARTVDVAAHGLDEVGNNPTFEGVPKKQVEAYVLDRELDLYDHVVDVEFEERLRGMVAFTNIPDLIETMRGDVDRARDLLSD